MSESNFKILIAGGSIAGLSLALMLQESGIDFLVLEAYREIAPQVGASIAILPNGMRILDQLGCYEAIMEEAKTPVTDVYFRRPTGEAFWELGQFSDVSIERLVASVMMHKTNQLMNEQARISYSLPGSSASDRSLV
jgi:2-polyprenyl-6-methoxyphenol hydroxylase-like FAD-dependent oxidoreductase